LGETGLKSFWSELRRRRVVRVAIAYIIGAWVLLQIGDVIFGLMEFPGWAGRALIVTLLAGLPIALILAWIFDFSPDGIIGMDDASGTTKEKAFTFSEPEPIDLAGLDLTRPHLTDLVGRSDECAVM